MTLKRSKIGMRVGWAALILSLLVPATVSGTGGALLAGREVEFRAESPHPYPRGAATTPSHFGERCTTWTSMTRLCRPASPRTA